MVGVREGRVETAVGSCLGDWGRWALVARSGQANCFDAIGRSETKLLV